MVTTAASARENPRDCPRGGQLDSSRAGPAEASRHLPTSPPPPSTETRGLPFHDGRLPGGACPEPQPQPQTGREKPRGRGPDRGSLNPPLGQCPPLPSLSLSLPAPVSVTPRSQACPHFLCPSAAGIPGLKASLAPPPSFSWVTRELVSRAHSPSQGQSGRTPCPPFSRGLRW